MRIITRTNYSDSSIPLFLILHIIQFTEFVKHSILKLTYKVLHRYLSHNVHNKDKKELQFKRI